MTIISIIVTFYNLDKNVFRRCLNSIYAQTCKNYEVLIIDDGSIQCNAQMLDDLTRSLSNTHVVHKINEGVSVARNLGVKIASGQYVTFVDGDDIISPFMVENFLAVKNIYDGDIFLGLKKHIVSDNIDDTSKIFSSKFEGLHILDCEEKSILYKHMLGDYKPRFIFGDCYVSRGPTEKIVKREWALNHPFDDKLKIGEDDIWNLSLLQGNPEIIVCKNLWYVYIKNEQSVTNAFHENCIKNYENYLFELRRYVLDEHYEYLYLETTLRCIGEISASYFCAEAYPYDIRVAMKQFNKMVMDYPWCYALKIKYLKKVGLKKRIKLLLIKFGIWMPVYVVKKYMGL